MLPPSPAHPLPTPLPNPAHGSTLGTASDTCAPGGLAGLVNLRASASRLQPRPAVDPHRNLPTPPALRTLTITMITDPPPLRHSLPGFVGSPTSQPHPLHLVPMVSPVKHLGKPSSCTSSASCAAPGPGRPNVSSSLQVRPSAGVCRRTTATGCSIHLCTCMVLATLRSCVPELHERW